MSVVSFTEAVAALPLGPLQFELDALLEPLSQDERRDVRDMLDLIARRLAARADGLPAFRSRLRVVIATLVDIADVLDGDCDLEDGDDAESHTALETAGRGFDQTPTTGHDDDEDGTDAEGLTDDNGIGDQDGVWQQGFGLIAERAHLAQMPALLAGTWEQVHG